MTRVSMICAVALLVAGNVYASDGVLEINQACAQQTGCFTGDSAGLPVTIAQAGSYRLTGNLTIPTNTTAIRIDTGDVTLDLGGFEVKGGNTCAGYPVASCTTEGGPGGIVGPTANEFLAVVRNGKVIGMSGACIDLNGNSSIVENVAVFYCGGVGIRVGFAGRVTQSFSSNNRSAGISFGDGGTVEGNEARGNGQEGIFLNSGFTLGVSAIGNRTTSNALSGIALGPRGMLSRNISASNGGGSFFGGTSLGDNLCNWLLC